MKKSIIKCATSLALSVGVLLSALIFSANAESKSTVQKWDFTKFEDYSYMNQKDGGHDAILSSDGNISMGCSNKYWNQQHDLKIENGKITQTDLNRWGSGIEFIMNFKLSSNLTKGQTYTFATDLCKTGAWPRVCLYYTDKISNGYNGDSNDHVTVPSGAIQLYKADGGENINNFAVTFTASENMNAGGYLNLRFKTGERDIVSTISSAELYKTVKDTPVTNTWDFSKFDNISHAKYEEYGAILSKDGNISTGVKEGEAYWNRFHVLDIKDGKLSQEDDGHSANHCEFIVNFKLTEDLKVGQKYIFKSDLKTTGAWVRPALYYTAAVSNSVNGESNEDVYIPTGAIKLYQFETKDGVTSAQLNNFTVEITPTEDLKAGGWLNLRYKTGGRAVTTTISKAALIENTDETLVSDNISLLGGAQVRFDKPTGLRFITQVKTSVVTELESLGATDIKFGTLIVPEDYLTASGAPEFTKASLTSANKKFLDIAYTGDTVAEGENDYFEMKAAIVNIYETNYKRNFAARAYVSYKIGDNEYTTYSDYNLVDNSRSVNYVATKLMADTEEYGKLSNTQKANVEAFTK